MRSPQKKKLIEKVKLMVNTWLDMKSYELE